MKVCFLLEGDRRVYSRKKSRMCDWFDYQYTLEYFDPKKYMILDCIKVNDFIPYEENIGYVITERRGKVK
jgi:hypothetical protein